MKAMFDCLIPGNYFIISLYYLSQFIRILCDKYLLFITIT